MIIPFPESGIQYLSDQEFFFEDSVVIQSGNPLDDLGSYLANELSDRFALNILLSTEEDSTDDINKSIILSLSKNDVLGDEGYYLRITGRQIIINAAKTEGIFYGIQSLLQLIYVTNSGDQYSLPPLEISDTPRFGWRGFMLDEARHFQGKESVMEILDLLALLKINRFHWHLTDDQGWRIELDNFSKLVKIGSKRSSTRIGGVISSLTRRSDNSGHMGYYSKDEISEIIMYAKERYIEVIPEIDLPGHTSALIASYPELSCHGEQIEVPGSFGIKKDILCAGKDEVFVQIEGMLEEIIELFPSSFIHIGGDETPKTNWMKCANCQRRLAEEGLEDEEALQGYFMNRVANFLQSRGKQVIMWNDGMHQNLDPLVIGQYWLFNHQEVIEEMMKGREFIISRFFYTYLDYNYHLTPLQKVYDFDPIPEELGVEHQDRILGIEAPLWTEWVRDRKRLYWQILPRLIAIAENGWSRRENKNYENFFRRLSDFVKILKSREIPYAHLGSVNPGRLSRAFHALTHLWSPRMRFG